jgi:hypothetical protein
MIMMMTMMMMMVVMMMPKGKGTWGGVVHLITLHSLFHRFDF